MSCRVEDDILNGAKPLPQSPSLPGLAVPTRADVPRRDSMQHGYTPPPSSPMPPAPAPFAPGGLKFDDGKVPLHLLPFDALTEIAKVLQFGARKYAVNNWRKGIVYSRLFRAAIGHLWSWWMGEDLDPETDLSHLAHAGCCVLFMLHFAIRGAGVIDDRAEHNA